MRLSIFCSYHSIVNKDFLQNLSPVCDEYCRSVAAYGRGAQYVLKSSASVDSRRPHANNRKALPFGHLSPCMKVYCGPRWTHKPRAYQMRCPPLPPSPPPCSSPAQRLWPKVARWSCTWNSRIHCVGFRVDSSSWLRCVPSMQV